MCFAIPKRVIKIEKNTAITEDNRRVMLGAVKTRIGDYLLIYGTIAIEKINKKRAEAFRKVLTTR